MPKFPEFTEDDEVIVFETKNSKDVDINLLAPMLVQMMQDKNTDAEIVLFDLDLTIQVEQHCTVEEIVEGFNSAVKQHAVMRNLATPTKRKPKGPKFG